MLIQIGPFINITRISNTDIHNASYDGTWWVDAEYIEENNTIEFTYDQNKKVWLMKSDDPNIGADNLVLGIEFADGYEYSLPDKQRYETCEMPALNNIGGLL